MSFSSILSSTTVEPTKSVVIAEPPCKPPRSPRPSSKTPNGDDPPAPASQTPASSTGRRSSHKQPAPLAEEPVIRDHIKEPTKHKISKSTTVSKPAPTISDKENEEVQQAMAEIDAMDHSDIDGPEWKEEKGLHQQMGKKRQVVVEETEITKRKVCCVYLIHATRDANVECVASPNDEYSKVINTAGYRGQPWQSSIQAI